MYNVKNITNDLFWVGAHDRRIALFEGVYHAPQGVSYNSYVLLDSNFMSHKLFIITFVGI